MVNNVASTDACVKICANDTRCEKAVYDKKGKICHVKDVNSGVRMPWESNEQFDSIRISTVALAEGTYASNF
jgi:galactose oxidase